MCSTPGQRIAAIGQAIDDLAAQARSAGQPTQGTGGSADPIVLRLAELWAQLAELDPEVARRMPTYEA